MTVVSGSHTEAAVDGPDEKGGTTMGKDRIPLHKLRALPLDEAIKLFADTFPERLARSERLEREAMKDPRVYVVLRLLSRALQEALTISGELPGVGRSHALKAMKLFRDFLDLNIDNYESMVADPTIGDFDKPEDN